MKRPKNILILSIFVSISSLGISQTTYSYQFTDKLRSNIDHLIEMGIDDTCGTIDIQHPIELTSKSFIGNNTLHFQLKNDCSKYIDLRKVGRGHFLEVVLNEKYEIFINSRIVALEDVNRLTHSFFTMYLKDKADIAHQPHIMLRVDRSCSNSEKINTVLNAVHGGHFSFSSALEEENSIPLIFHLGTSSRAEPPLFNISEE